MWGEWVQELIQAWGVQSTDLVTKSITSVSGMTALSPSLSWYCPIDHSFMKAHKVCEPVCFWCNRTGCDAVTPGRDLGHFYCSQSHGPCKDNLPTQSICTMLSWNLRVKHILPVALQAFHPTRQSPACSIALSGLDQQRQSSNCITVSLSSSCTCWLSPKTRYWSGWTFACPRWTFFFFLSSWYAFEKTIWGCARKIDLEVLEKDHEENSWSAATADNLWRQLALFEKYLCDQLLRGPLGWMDLSSFFPTYVTQGSFYCLLLSLGWTTSLKDCAFVLTVGDVRAVSAEAGGLIPFPPWGVFRETAWKLPRGFAYLQLRLHGSKPIAGYQLLKSGLIRNVNKEEGSSTS